MDQIQFRTGNMLTFVATRGFALGSTGIQVAKGMEILFDGTKVEVDGSEVSMPQLRGAIRSGWLVLSGAFDSDSTEAERPRSANIQMRHSTQGGNPFDGKVPDKRVAVVTESDEREVGSTSAHAESARQSNANRGKAARTVGTSNLDMQEGVPVRTLKTAAGERAKQARTVLTAESLGSEIRKAENVQIEAGEGLSEADYLERMGEQERSEYLAKKEAAKARLGVESSAPKAVSKVKRAKAETREGVTAVVTTGGGVETADPVDLGGKVEVSEHMEDGIVFRNTNGPKKQSAEPHPRSEEAQKPVMLRDGTADARLRVAKAICKSFPDNYNFADSDRKKLARLAADYEDQEDVLRAVFAAESDAMKAKLLEEFPAVFGA